MIKEGRDLSRFLNPPPYATQGNERVDGNRLVKASGNPHPDDMGKGGCDPLLVTFNHLSGDFYLNEATVAGKGAARGHCIRGEDVHAASSVKSLGVRAKPSARVQASHPRHNAVCNVSSHEQLASIIEHSDLVAGVDTPRLGVSGVEPNCIVGQQF
jgi:hypothetical protein